MCECVGPPSYGGDVSMNRSFEVIPGDPDSPVVLQVPRASAPGPVDDAARLVEQAVRRAAFRAWIVDRPARSVVEERLAAAGEATVVDVRTFPATPGAGQLPEPDPRPEVCVGTDPFHTPRSLRDAAVEAMRAVTPTGDVECDSPVVPLAGLELPQEHRSTNPQVTAVVLGLRHDVLAEHVDDLAVGVADLLDAIAPR